MKYLFTAESQYIFSVTIEGRPRLVKFGDKNNFGVCAFATDDDNIAAKIRSLTVFKRGAIVEATSPSPSKGGGVNPEAEATDAGAEEAQQKTAGNEGGTDSVKTFADFTRAKEWICKEFGLQKNKVRNPKALDEIAAEHGIIIQYETE